MLRRGSMYPDKFYEALYVNDVSIVKKIGDKYKLSCHRGIRNSNVETGVKIKHNSSRGLVNDEKLDNNILRSRNIVFELAYCNDWEWFTTLTINKEKWDRYKLDDFYKDFSRYIINRNRYMEDKIKYVLVPELHKDGAWHLHGLMVNIPIKELYEFNREDFLPYSILNRIEKGDKVFKWTSYSSRYGFSLLENIRNKEAAARYITKYITKEISDGIELNKHMYYCSKGLNRGEIVKKGMLRVLTEFDYGNEFVKVKWGGDELIEYIM